MDLFTIENLMTLLMLIFLQAVLGFDNLLYISIESKRVEESRQSAVRRWGVGIAIVLRLVLLFVVMLAIEHVNASFFSLHWENVVTGAFDVHNTIVIVGGVFIIYTAMKEIFHLIAIDHIEGENDRPKRSVPAAVTWIVLVNLVFSFDSILSALALTRVFLVMAAAIVISGVLMIVLADHVAEFLKRNRMFEVLGLFILLIVGVMLLSEGGHLAHLKFFGYQVEQMSKTTFYFVIIVLVLIDIVQSVYQKKLMARRRAELARAHVPVASSE